jgi:hydrogenase nickel incorporation protein HypA/HybF
VHELAIAQSIASIAESHAHGRPVARVYVKVGHLRQVVPSALAFAFELVTEDTTMHGAGLDIEHVPAMGDCRACGWSGPLAAFPLACGNCGGLDLGIVQGEELLVESLEIENAPTGSAGKEGTYARSR